MPAFIRKQSTPEEIENVAAYVLDQSEKNCQSPVMGLNLLSSRWISILLYLSCQEVSQWFEVCDDG